MARACKNYCLEVWTEALNPTRVPAASEWSRVKNVYYYKDLREAPTDLRQVLATMTALEQLPITQASLPPLETSKGLGKAGDQGQKVEVAKGKEAAQGRTRPKAKDKRAGHGKEVSQAKPLPETKGLEANLSKETASKAKESELIKPQVVAQEKKATSSKTADPSVPQPGSKEDPSPTQTQLGSVFSSYIFFFCLWQFAMVYNVPFLFFINEKMLTFAL